MQEQRERWMKLCEQAATEQDPEKLMALIAEINRLLEAKERRLRHNPPVPRAGRLVSTYSLIFQKIGATTWATHQHPIASPLQSLTKDSGHGPELF